MSSNHPIIPLPPPSRQPHWALCGLAAVLLALGGCARQSVVLVPDANGHVGTAEVSTATGRQVLQKANDMTQIGSGARATPSAITTAQADFITATFGEVLAIEPAPAKVFTLLFESGTAQLRPDALAQLEAIVNAATQKGTVRVSISGHSDATGSAQLNDTLSRQRAEQVQALLLERGVAAKLMDVSSHGKNNPLVPTPDGVAEPRNRRVMVVVR